MSPGEIARTRRASDPLVSRFRRAVDLDRYDEAALPDGVDVHVYVGPQSELFLGDRELVLCADQECKADVSQLLKLPTTDGSMTSNL
jgi:hypothetical protein